jgi:CBS domain-containing protein
MEKHMITVPPEMTVPELAQMLTQKMISGVPVVDRDGEVVGVVSLSDVATNAARQQAAAERIDKHPEYYRDLWMDADLTAGYIIEDYGSNATVGEIMTRVLHVVHEDDSLVDLTNLLLGARIHRALVTNGERVVGIVTTMDLIRVIPQLLPH